MPQSASWGFLLKGGGGIFLLQREGLLGKNCFIYPSTERIHIPASLGSSENSSTQKCRLMGSGDMWNRSPGFGNSSKEFNLTGYKSPAAARKAVPSEDNLKHKLRGFQNCSWFVMLIHSGLQGSCHHHLYRRLASKTHLEENWKNLTNPDKPQSHLKRGDFRLVNYYFSEN